VILKMFFSPLGTPTPLGSMAHQSSQLSPFNAPEEDDLQHMDYHLRQMESFEAQKLEQSVDVSGFF
jgi:hypothetical protein